MKEIYRGCVWTLTWVSEKGVTGRTHCTCSASEISTAQAVAPISARWRLPIWLKIGFDDVQWEWRMQCCLLLYKLNNYNKLHGYYDSSYFYVQWQGESVTSDDCYVAQQRCSTGDEETEGVRVMGFKLYFKPPYNLPYKPSYCQFIITSFLQLSSVLDIIYHVSKSVYHKKNLK